MQVTPTSSGQVSPAGGLKQINATPQLALPGPLAATVLTSFPVSGVAESYAGQLRLALTNELLNYISQQSLPVGQNITLQPTSEGTYRATPQAATAPQLLTSLTTQTLRDLLPLTQSGSFIQLLESLRYLVTANQTLEEPMPEAFQRAAKALLQNIPQVNASAPADAVHEWVQPQLTPPESLLGQGKLPPPSSPDLMLANLLQQLPMKERPAPLPARSSTWNSLSAEVPASDTSSAPGTLTLNRSAQAGTSPASEHPTAPLVYVLQRPLSTNPPLAETSAPAYPLSAQIPDEFAALLETALPQDPSPNPEATSTTDQGTPTTPPKVVAEFSLPLAPPNELGNTLHQVHELILATLANHQMNRAITTLQHAGVAALPATLHSLPQENQQVLFMNTMPIMVGQHYHAVDLQIGQREATPQGGQSTHMIWIISLGFDLEGLGRIVAKGELQGRSLGTDFWAENEMTRLLLDRRLPDLATQLKSVGLNISHLTTHSGLPATPPSDQPPLSLIDVSI